VAIFLVVSVAVIPDIISEEMQAWFLNTFGEGYQNYLLGFFVIGSAVLLFLTTDIGKSLWPGVKSKSFDETPVRQIQTISLQKTRGILIILWLLSLLLLGFFAWYYWKTGGLSRPNLTKVVFLILICTLGFFLLLLTWLNFWKDKSIISIHIFRFLLGLTIFYLGSQAWQFLYDLYLIVRNEIYFESIYSVLWIFIPNQILLLTGYYLTTIIRAPVINLNSWKQKKYDWKWFMRTGILVAGVILVYFIWLQFNAMSTSGAKPVIVIVQGTGGKQDIIRRNEGYVIMEVNGERKREAINEGEAVFRNLPVATQFRLNVDLSEPYALTHPDSVYTMNGDGAIYLEVALPSLMQVFGSVISKEGALPGVLVSIGSQMIDTTDATGRFQIRIPQDQQRKALEVRFDKSGYKSVFLTAYPQTGEALKVIMDK